MNRILKKIKSHFITGLVTLLPFAVTIYVVLWIVEQMDSIINTLIPYSTFPGMGFIIMIILITALGFLTNNIFGKFILKKWENFVEKLPIIRSIYNAIKQMLNTFMQKDTEHLGTPILIKFPNPEIYSVGFLTKEEACFALGNKKGREYITAYIPTAPNPTTGFVIVIKRDQVKPINMDGHSALQGIISMGFSFKDAVKSNNIKQPKESGG